METADIVRGPTRGQFSLRSILVLMTGAAVACALGAAMGERSVALLAGMFLCFANYLGFFTWFQRRRTIQIALYAAAVLWAISLLLPAMVIMSTVEPGYMAAYYSFMILILGTGGEIAEWLASSTWTPGPGHSARDVRDILMCLLSTWANLAILVSPCVAHRLAAGKWRWCGGALLIAAPGVWGLVAPDESWRIGFYVWVAAITVPAIVLSIRVRAFAMMLMVAILVLWVYTVGT